jgi:carbamoyl-phosphate synthase large subunit
LYEAYYLSWLATDQSIKNKSIFLSVPGLHKAKFVEEASRLIEKGWQIYTTPGTHRFLYQNGVKTTKLFKIQTKQKPNVASLIEKHKLGLMINIPSDKKDTKDAFTIRRLAIDNHIPLLTNAETGRLLMMCLSELDLDSLDPKHWREYFNQY